MSLLERLRPSRQSKPVRMVVGLRNPGRDYAGTRHNVGFEVLQRFLDRHGVTFGRAPLQLQVQMARIGVGDEALAAAAPLSFMNQSGGPVKGALDYFKIEPTSMLVIHDDIDLDFGRLRLQEGGGPGGHNGVRSVEKALGTNDFHRLKVGVGRPPDFTDPAEYVLRPFPKAELEEVEFILEDACDVVDLWRTDFARAQERAALRRVG